MLTLAKNRSRSRPKISAAAPTGSGSATLANTLSNFSTFLDVCRHYNMVNFVSRWLVSSFSPFCCRSSSAPAPRLWCGSWLWWWSMATSGSLRWWMTTVRARLWSTWPAGSTSAASSPPGRAQTCVTKTTKRKNCDYDVPFISSVLEPFHFDPTSVG